MNNRTVSRRQFVKLLGGLTSSGLLLAACAPSQSEAPATTNEGGAGVTAEKTTLTQWDFGGGEFEYIDSALIPEFLERQPDIQIEHVGIPEDGFTTKVMAAVSSGTQPDVSVCFDNTWWKAGLCVALDDLLQAEGINWQQDYFLPVLQLHCLIDDGKLYGMPVLAHTNAAIIDLDRFEEAGLEPWDVTLAYDFSKWYEMAKMLDVPAEDISQRIWGTGWLDPKWSSVKHAQARPNWSGADGHTAIGNIDSPEWIQMYQFMHQVWQEELTPIGDVAQGLGADPFLLKQMGFKGLGWERDYRDALDEGVNARIVQKPCVGPEQGATGLGGWTTPWTIFKSSEHPEEAGAWVYYLGTDGAISFGKYEGLTEPPCLKKLAEDRSLWAANEEDADIVLYILENSPEIVFTPNFRPLVDPMAVAWTRITQENVPLEAALHEGAEEVQQLLDEAWEQWESLGA